MMSNGVNVQSVEISKTPETVREIFQNLSYGPAPEADNVAQVSLSHQLTLHSFFSTYLLPLIPVDHSILLTRLQNWFGLDGLSLDWFSSYLSLRSQAVSINDSISTFSTLSCGVPPRFRTWPTPFHSLYNSSWLGDLKKFPQISFVRWWHPAVHLFHSYNFCSISWNTYYHFQWHSLLDELEQTASQSIKNWISSHWHKTTVSQIFWSNKLISQ